jgi:hypothetical protein
MEVFGLSDEAWRVRAQARGGVMALQATAAPGSACGSAHVVDDPACSSRNTIAAARAQRQPHVDPLAERVTDDPSGPGVHDHRYL